MLNGYIWKNYLKADGQNVVDLFEKILCDSFSEEDAHKIYEMHKTYCPSEVISEELFLQLKELCDADNIDRSEFSDECCSSDEEPDGECSIESIINAVYQALNPGGSMSDNQIFDQFTCGMACYTTLLAMEYPELFVPYYYKYNYNVFETIAHEFEIQLPPIPKKKNYKARVYYYGEICAALLDFRSKHGMSAYELCAFLYDFAPKYIGGTESYIINELPEPKSVFFIGGSKDDIFLEGDSDTIRCWQCNPDARAGDLILMYLRTPISAVDSIWRSVAVGFNDPFFYYYRCTYMAKPQRIKRITQKQLQQDEIFKELPIVRKNMQGINGVELYPSAYNHLLDMAECDLPRLEYMADNADGSLAHERDVENKLIKVLLEKLGYTEKEYQQQLYIEIGNHNHALIPDFVIHPVINAGHQSADFLVEAKFSIPSIKRLEEAKTQARGYAKLLNAKYSVVAAKEGIWISRASDDYSSDVLSFTWEALKLGDNFFQVFKLLGKAKAL